MKFSHLMLAVALLGTGVSAQADTQRLAGASASLVNVTKALKQLCGAGTFKAYKTTSSTSSLGNIVTATCSTPFVDAVDQVRINVNGGSLSAVLNRGGNTGAVTAKFIDPTAATCTALGAGTGALSFALNGELQNCTTTGQLDEFSQGGYLDVEGGIFGATGQTLPPEVDITTDFPAASFQQVFGVGVSTSLYKALQEYQTIKAQLPANCTTVAGLVHTATGSTTPECQPNVSKAAFTSFVAAGNNTAKKAGANFLFGGSAVVANDLTAGGATMATAAPLGTDFVYCRRPATSGTQASAQVYFLHNPTATGDLGGALAVAGQAVSGQSLIGANYIAKTNSGTSDVRTCLNGATDFAAGVLSMENNPIGTDSYRFLKINGQSGSGGVAGDSQTAEAIAGRYDFVFESVKYCPAGVCVSVLDAIDTALLPGASTAGLFLAAEAKFSRGGKATAPYIARP